MTGLMIYGSIFCAFLIPLLATIVAQNIRAEKPYLIPTLLLSAGCAIIVSTLLLK